MVLSGLLESFDLILLLFDGVVLWGLIVAVVIVG